MILGTISALISAEKRVLFLTRQGVAATLEDASPRVDLPVEAFGAAKPRVTASSTRMGLSGEWRLTSLPGTRLSVETGLRPPTLVIAGAEQKISARPAAISSSAGASPASRTSSRSIPPV